MNRIGLKKWMEAINLTIKIGWAGLTLMSALGYDRWFAIEIFPVWPFLWMGLYQSLTVTVTPK